MIDHSVHQMCGFRAMIYRSAEYDNVMGGCTMLVHKSVIIGVPHSAALGGNCLGSIVAICS